MMGDNIKHLGLKKGLRILEKMSEVLLTTFEGQYLELEWTRRARLQVSENDYLDMVKRKTSYYTVVGPAQLGALCADKGQPRVMKAIESWGIPFGCAYQILDDLSDVFSDMQDSSKARGGDIQESKRTLILIHLLKHASPKEKKQIRDIYKKPAGTKTWKDKRFVINLFHKYDSLGYVRDIAAKFAREAEQAFLRSTSDLPDSKSKGNILELIRFATSLKS
jgi:geranylgeranyl diphosphate synthase type II